MYSSTYPPNAQTMPPIPTSTNPFNPLLPNRPGAHLPQGVFPSGVDGNFEHRSRYDISIQDRPCKMVPQIFSVDSRYRNYAVQGSMGATSVISHTAYARDQYTVPLPSVFRDTVSIELIKAAVPEPEGCIDLDRRYLILSIGFSHIIGNNPAVTGSFCNLYPSAAGGYSYTRGGTPDVGYIYYFPEPGTLSKLDIRLTYPDGRAPVFQGDHVLTFEIRGLNQPKVLLC